MKRVTISGLAFLLGVCLVAPALAQNKLAKCGHIRIVVDRNDGSGWTNDYLELALLEEGGGWVVAAGDDRGQNVAAKKGDKLRFNFNDGKNHPIDVTCTTKSGSVKARAGSRPAIVLVDVTSGGRAALHFEITGAANPKARIDGCPGGNFYIEAD